MRQCPRDFPIVPAPSAATSRTVVAAVSMAVPLFVAVVLKGIPLSAEPLWTSWEKPSPLSGVPGGTGTRTSGGIGGTGSSVASAVSSMTAAPGSSTFRPAALSSSWVPNFCAIMIRCPAALCRLYACAHAAPHSCMEAMSRRAAAPPDVGSAASGAMFGEQALRRSREAKQLLRGGDEPGYIDLHQLTYSSASFRSAVGEVLLSRHVVHWNRPPLQLGTDHQLPLQIRDIVARHDALRDFDGRSLHGGGLDLHAERVPGERHPDKDRVVRCARR